MGGKIKEVLGSITNAFETGEIPEAIAYCTFPVPELPSSKWSLLNRVRVFLAGTLDARGYRQWKNVGRFVKKGAKAIYILTPRMVKRIIETEEGEEQEEYLVGFAACPVFRVEDTNGAVLDYQQIELPELPLMDKAQEWGISVKAIPGNYQYHGYFCQARMEIVVATREEAVFFHELSHAAHRRIVKDFAGLESWRKEVVAELAAAALCRIVGKTSKHLGNHFRYISHYAKEANLSAVQACLLVMNDVEMVLGEILRGSTCKELEVRPVIAATA